MADIPNPTADLDWRDESAAILPDDGKPIPSDRETDFLAKLATVWESNSLYLGPNPAAKTVEAVKLAAEAESSAAALTLLTDRLARHVSERCRWHVARQPPKRQWLIPDWLPAGRVGLLAGVGGTGKTRLAMQVAAGLAAGSDTWLPSVSNTWGLPELNHWHGGKSEWQSVPESACEPVHTVYASWEDETAEAARRLHYMNRSPVDERESDRIPGAWHGLPDLTESGLGDRFHWLDFGAHGPLWGPDTAHGSGHTSTVGKLYAAGQTLRNRCESVGARLLVIDPIAAAFGSNENDRALVRDFMANWQSWAFRTGCAVLILSHPPKTKGAAYSGSTDWQAAARFLWTLERRVTAWQSVRVHKTDSKRAYVKLIPAGDRPDGVSIIDSKAAGIKLTLDKSNYGRRGDSAWLRVRGHSGAAWQQCHERQSAEAVLIHETRGAGAVKTSAESESATESDGGDCDGDPF